MRKISIILWLSSFIFLLWHTFAINVMEIPPLDNFVVDYTQTLTSSQIESLSSGAYTIQQNTSAQIAALVIPDRWWYELYDIALNVFRTTWLWDKKLNNGLLLIIAKDEKKLRLTVGYGLEWTIPDVEANQIVEEIRPFVNNGDMYGAIEHYYKLITPYLDGTIKARTENTDIYNFSLRDQIWGILFFIAISSAFWSKNIFKQHSNKFKKPILTIGTIWLIIIALISLFLFSFGFIGALIWYIVGIITWTWWFKSINRWWYRWWGFGWNWWWWWSSWWFSGGFGWSSWGGGAGD